MVRRVWAAVPRPARALAVPVRPAQLQEAGRTSRVRLRPPHRLVFLSPTAMTTIGLKIDDVERHGAFARARYDRPDRSWRQSRRSKVEGY